MKNDQTSILIHANGTIQITEHRGSRIRLGLKTFRLADQAHSDTMLGPFVYTETTTPQNVNAEIIPFPRHRIGDVRTETAQEVYAH